MKKLLVKAEIVTQAYSPAVLPIPGSPESWAKEIVKEDGIVEIVVKYEAPLLEDGSIDPSYNHFPAIDPVFGSPEIPEVKEWKVIAQTQGSDEDLALWLEGDKHKYPEGYVVEYIDIFNLVLQEKINEDALKYLAETDWLIIRQIDSGIPCPEEVKIKRQEARDKIIH